MSTDPEERGRAALGHIVQAIERYRLAVGDLSAQALLNDVVRYHAAERLVEIISEASRRLPKHWKDEFSDVPWADIASIGNVLRHNYSIVDHLVIHELQGEPLLELERVIRRMADRFGS